MRRKTCCALRPSINRRSPFFDPTSKTIAIVRLHESHVWHTFLRSNYAPHCNETVIAQVYDLTVALRNNYIPLTQLLLRKLTRPFLREGGAGVRDYPPPGSPSATPCFILHHCTGFPFRFRTEFLLYLNVEAVHVDQSKYTFISVVICARWSGRRMETVVHFHAKARLPRGALPNLTSQNVC